MPGAMAPLSVCDSWSSMDRDGRRGSYGEGYSPGPWPSMKHSLDNSTSRMNGHSPFGDSRPYPTNKNDPRLPDESPYSLKRSRDEYERSGDPRFNYAPHVPPQPARRHHFHSPPRAGRDRRQDPRRTSVSNISLQSSPDRSRRHLPFARWPSDSGARADNSPGSARRPRRFGTDMSPQRSPSASRFAQSSPPARNGPLQRSPHGMDPRMNGPNFTRKSPDQHTHWSTGASGSNAVPQGAKDPRIETAGMPNSDNTNLEFNGHKYIPIGPKYLPTRFPGTAMLPELSPDIKRLPHIFISGAFVPPQTSTVQHLQLFLRQHIDKQSHVRVDSTGYYVTFTDDEQGRDELDACYRAKHRSRLFGEYVLEMSRFPNGQTSAVDREERITGAPPAELGKHGTPEQTGTRAPFRADAGMSVSGSVCTGELESPVGNPLEKCRPASHLADTLNTSSSAASTCDNGQKSSPMRVPSRDKDDTVSSVSSWTDFSASKPMKCHTCKAGAVTESEALVQCSTCPRRYHRRCHPKPQIPRDLRSGHNWQCKRCTRKHVAPNTSRKSSPLAVNNFLSSVAQRTEVDEIPRHAAAFLEDPQTAQVSSPLFKTPVNSGMAPEERRTTGIDTVDNMSGPHPSACVQPSVPETPPSPVHHIEEADDLVEKSFNKMPSLPSNGDRSTIGVKLMQRPHSNGDTILPEQSSQSLVEGADRNVFRARVDEQGALTPRQIPQEHTSVLSEKITPSRTALDDPAAARESSVPRGRPHDLSEAHDSPFEGAEESDATKTVVDRNVNPSGVRQSQASTADKAGLQKNSSGPSIKASRSQKSKMQRVKCDRCNRSIAYDPSEERLCTHCKKGTATTAGNSSGAAQAITNKSKVVLPLTDGANKTQLSTSKDAIRTAQMQEPKTHVSTVKQTPIANIAALVESPVPGSSKPLHMPPRIEEPSQSKGHESDLDFWKPRKPAHDKVPIPPAEKEQPSLFPMPQTRQGSPRAPSPGPTVGQRVQEAAADNEVKHKKRKSSKSIARSSSDLGDSEIRPTGTYKTLIGMALLSQKGVPMTSKEMVQWVVDNIPGYVRSKDGKWENGLRATVTMHQEGNSQKNRPVWKPRDKGSQPFFWMLLPGAEKYLMRWDAERKEPVSAVTPMNARAVGTNADGDAHLVSIPQVNSINDDVMSHTSAYGELETHPPPKKRKLTHETTPPPLTSQPKPAPKVPPPRADQISASPGQEQPVESGSFDEQPLARQSSSAASPRVPVATVQPEADHMEVEQQSIDQTPNAVNRSVLPRVPPIITNQLRTSTCGDHHTLAQIIKAEAEQADFSATSLFKEWPEHDPANAFDRAAKLREIKQRPNRKQRMRQGRDAWNAWTPTRLQTQNHSQQTSASFERQYRSPRKQMIGIDPDTFDASGVTRCETIEELFDVPPNLMTIMSEGQIAFRDGTRNEDGSLPRAREIFKVGYL